MKKSVIATLASGALISCGGGGSDGPREPSLPIVVPPAPPGPSIPVDQVPISALGIVELGPISGGTVQFLRSSGQNLGSYTTSGTGEINYNPRDIVRQLGSDQYVVAYVSGGSDIDPDDDGFQDATPTPVRGSFRMIIMRSSLERGDPIVVNPRAGLVSEILLGRTRPLIEKEILDELARETGAEDQNNDGRVDYRDIVSIQMKDARGVSKVVPFVSGYIASVHNGNTSQKNIALKNVARTESHILRSIIPNPSSLDHTPALRLQSVSDGSILYTLDGSIPLSGGAATRSAQGELIIPMQNAKLYYREQFTLNGETVLGKVRGFDLISDWTELSQEVLSYNPTGTPSTTIEPLSYKNIPYTITTIANQINPAYTYPKTIGCKVGTAQDAGCHNGPYMVWSPEHENRVRELIKQASQTYIDSLNTLPVPPINLEDIYRNPTSYNGASYTIKNTWTLGNNNTRIFPVVVLLTVNRKDGQIHTLSRVAYNQTELGTINTQIEQSAKTYIDADNVVKPIHPRNHQESYTGGIVYNYYGGYYEVSNTYNLEGTSDFPVRISGVYKAQDSEVTIPSILMAANETERIQKSNQMVADAQRALQAAYKPVPPPTYPINYLIDSGFIGYRTSNGVTYGYNLLTTMNTTGSSDYPARVRVRYSTPVSNSNYTVDVYADNATELSSLQAAKINEATAQIDIILDADKYPPNFRETVTNSAQYGGGSYSTVVTYNGLVGKDYPAFVDVYRTFRNGSGDTWTVSVDTESSKLNQISEGEVKARADIDNYNPSYPANHIATDGPYKYGRRGSSYTYMVKYNRIGNGANYPALVWIEYRSGNGGVLQDTRTTYGPMIANSSVEKEQMKETLLAFVQGQMMALGGVDTPVYATRYKFHELLPLSTAHAATPSMFVKKAEFQLPNFAPAGLGLMYGQFYANGNITQHWVSNRANTKSVATSTQSSVALKLTIADISRDVDILRNMYVQCSGVGTTIPVGNSSGCVMTSSGTPIRPLTPAELEQVRLAEQRIYTKIANYVGFPGGLAVGAGAAIYDEIMGIGSDVVDLADGMMIREFEMRLADLKSKLSVYIVNGVLDINKVRTNLISGATAIEQEISALISELPGALNSLDEYNKGYYTGQIGGGIILEFVNPVKKAKLIAKGFTYGSWLYKARYLIDSNRAGHSLAQKNEIMKKLDRVQWSRVEKPDMSKISHPDLITQINLNYKPTSVIGNGSNADAIRYTKTTGLLVGVEKPSDHLQKGQDTLNALKKRFNANDLTSVEKPIAQALYNDIQAAMNGN